MQIVSVSELCALTAAFFPPTLSMPRLTNKFLEVVEEGAAMKHKNIIREQKGDGGSHWELPSSSDDRLVSAYQQVLMVALLSSVQQALSIPVSAAGELFSRFSCTSSREDWEEGEEEQIRSAARHPTTCGMSQSQATKNGATSSTRGGSIEGEKINSLQRQKPPGKSHESSLDGTSSLWTEDIEPKVLLIASKASYHKASAADAWKDGIILRAAEGCLRSIRMSQKFLQLLPAAGSICALLHDRAVAAASSSSSDCSAVLEALSRALGLADSNNINTPLKDADTSVCCLLMLGVVVSLADRLPVGSAARRQLWRFTRDGMLSLSAQVLERYEVRRSKRSRRKGSHEVFLLNATAEVEADEELHAVAMVSRAAEFFVCLAPTELKVPPSTPQAANWLQDVLLTSGLHRGITLAFGHHGADPRLQSLRRAVLACCAATPGLLHWSLAVPEFKASWQQPVFLEGGDFCLHGAVFECISGETGKSTETVATCLGQLADGGAGGVPAVHAALQVLSVVHAASRGRVVWGESVDVVLAEITVQLRSLSNRNGSAENAGNEEEHRKVYRSREEQATLLTDRQAQLLQPECIRLIKQLRSKPDSLGKSD